MYKGINVKNTKKGGIYLNIFENLGEAIKETIENTVEKASEINISKGSNIKSEEIELAQKLDAVEEFSIDRFEGDIAVLENRKTGKIEEIEKNKLPNGIKEGDILQKINGKYNIDKVKTQEVKNNIKDKMNKIWE